MSKINKDELFSKDNEAQSNWFKFEKVGDRVSGILVGTSDAPEKGVFKANRVYDIEQADGSIMRVGIPVTKEGTILRANGARLGDTLGFEFFEEIPPSEKGFAPAKSIKVYIIKRPDNADEQFANA